MTMNTNAEIERKTRRSQNCELVQYTLDLINTLINKKETVGSELILFFSVLKPNVIFSFYCDQEGQSLKNILQFL